MQFLKRVSSSVLAPLIRQAPPSLPSLLSQTNCVSLNPICFNPLRHLSVTPVSHFITSSPLEQKKERKLFAHMYGGGDNSGVDYGWEVMNEHRLGPHKKTRPIRNPLGYNIPYAKGVVIKTLIKKPKKPNSANRKVGQSCHLVHFTVWPCYSVCWCASPLGGS